ncbi:ABC transporter permease [Alkalibacterium kapii]|uniref:ABC transporter n=1 Tax=Alkalibacterium kapii TaxID=426704 RepID=A0A511ATB9_9LACT|nr:ABC transporter permease [Alkalibacterium kapii]GEK91449.1 ABC transporter [Alkalibacterium kapii]
MTITDLFKERQTNYYKRMSKYLKYVLNDHFVILVLFLGGATALAYQNYLKSIQVEAVLPRMILMIITVIAVFSGSIRTLIEPADAVFLLPKEKALNKLMKKNMVHSLIFHNSYMLLLGGVGAPILLETDYTGRIGLVFWLLFLVIWKTIYGLYIYYSLKQHKKTNNKNVLISMVSVFLISLTILLFFSVSIGFITSIISFFLYSFVVFKSDERESWNWEKLIETEQKRIQKIYSIINLFIETPYSKHRVKRLKSMDFLYAIPVLKKVPEIYYLSRMFIRNYNFSGLYLRLLVIGSIAIYFSENWIINSVISVLFLYLTGFQLVPLEQIIKKSIHFRLYPNSGNKLKSVQQLILMLLVISSLVYSLFSFNAGNTAVLGLLFLNSVFTLFFTYLYLPARLKG